MLIFVFGGSASGKSAYGERRLCELAEGKKIDDVRKACRTPAGGSDGEGDLYAKDDPDIGGMRGRKGALREESDPDLENGASTEDEQIADFSSVKKIYLATMEKDGIEARERIAAHRKERRELGFITVECARNIRSAIGIFKNNIRNAGGGEAVNSTDGMTVDAGEGEAANADGGMPVDAGEGEAVNVIGGMPGNAVRDAEENAFILVEAASNLLANEMFGGETMADADGEEEAPPSDSKAIFHHARGIAERVFSDIMALSEKAEAVVVVSDDIFADGEKYDEMTEAYRAALGFLHCRISSVADEVVEVICGIPVYRKRRLSGEYSKPNAKIMI